MLIKTGLTNGVLNTFHSQMTTQDLVNGDWKITIIEEGSDFVKVIPSIGDDYDDKHTEENTNDVPSYSDVLILDGDLEWVKVKGEKLKK